ncbi:MAG: cytochrome c maturation protein CcmE [Acidimicrobiales bacterium]
MSPTPPLQLSQRPDGPASGPPHRRRGHLRFQRDRLRLGIVIAAISGAVAFLVIQGLGDATTYFRNADEAVAQREELGTSRFRLQGAVVRGSVRGDDYSVRFDVEYDCATLPVRHRGDPPELFRPGIPVVLEGAFAPGGEVFESDRIMVRHTPEYRAENPDRNLDALATKPQRGCLPS